MFDGRKRSTASIILVVLSELSSWSVRVGSSFKFILCCHGVIDRRGSHFSFNSLNTKSEKSQ